MQFHYSEVGVSDCPRRFCDDTVDHNNELMICAVPQVGVDRIVMLLCGEENLREVVLFPMNQRAEDLMMGAPSEATPKQLKELHIRLELPKK